MNTEEIFYSKVKEHNNEHSCFGKEHDEYLDNLISQYVHKFIESLATLENFKEETKILRKIHINTIFYSLLGNMNKKYNYNILCPEFYNNNKVLPMLILAQKFQENIINNYKYYKKTFEDKIESEASQFECVYFKIESYKKEDYERSYEYFKTDNKRDLLIKEIYDFSFFIRREKYEPQLSKNRNYYEYKLNDVFSFNVIVELKRVVAPAGSLTESTTESGMVSLSNENWNHNVATHTKTKNENWNHNVATYTKTKNEKGIISNIWLIIKYFFGFHKSK